MEKMEVENSSAGIHDYRTKIANSIEQLKKQINKTDSAVETVSESWKDGVFQQFQRNFNEDKEKIIPLCDSLAEYVDKYLYSLEKKLEDYETTDVSIRN